MIKKKAGHIPVLINLHRGKKSYQIPAWHPLFCITFPYWPGRKLNENPLLRILTILIWIILKQIKDFDSQEKKTSFITDTFINKTNKYKYYSQLKFLKSHW